MADLTFNEYQVFTVSTAKYDQAICDYVEDLGIVDPAKRARLIVLLKVAYTTLGQVGEAGELANKLKKIIRDKQCYIGPDDRAALADENGDVTWYNCEGFRNLGVNYASGVAANVNKLQSRKERGQISGEGDKR